MHVVPSPTFSLTSRLSVCSSHGVLIEERNGLDVELTVMADAGAEERVRLARPEAAGFWDSDLWKCGRQGRARQGGLFSFALVLFGLGSSFLLIF